MFVKFGRTIINLGNVTDVYFADEHIVVYTTAGESIRLKIERADELEKALAKYNEIRGYKHD